MSEYIDHGAREVEHLETQGDEARGFTEEQFTSAFQQLYPRVFGRFYNDFGDPHAADEIAAQSFFLAWQGRHGFKGEFTAERFGRWLFGIGRNVVAERGREFNRTLKPSSLEQLSEAGHDIADSRCLETTVIERLGGIAALLERINPAHKQALLLRYIEGMSSKEIAEQMGRSQTAIDQLVWRSKAALRELIQSEDSAVA